ncbi:unnamed protein product [Gongylonema pulchrum]|uniref:YitH/HolE acetyltransferase (GNAT) domain-containing protein n=1 Tax=Gongylonema pulchrum TaxID=637853 RepID=A0A3P7N7F0_9BILA|nr:unnamed protein product [Gongylonema pulchrum]
MATFDSSVTGLKRDLWLKQWLGQENFDVFVAFKQNQLVGYGCSREVAGGYVLPIVVGPLYASDAETACALLYASLKKYYNPDEDYDWDPDVFAVYRRDVHFVVPEQNEQMMEVMLKLKGQTGTLAKNRLHYANRNIAAPMRDALTGGILGTFQTQATGSLPDVDFKKIFAVSDLHMAVV